jgi:hypothetical protein
MARFPLLKTGAVAQYPLEERLAFRNELLWFVDGSRQAYRGAGEALKRWVIRLELLEPSEARTLEEFYMEHKGGFGVFSFVDPVDQQEYPNCSFDQQECTWEFSGERRGAGVLIVRQNRS